MKKGMLITAVILTSALLVTNLCAYWVTLRHAQKDEPSYVLHVKLDQDVVNKGPSNYKVHEYKVLKSSSPVEYDPLTHYLGKNKKQAEKTFDAVCAQTGAQ